MLQNPIQDKFSYQILFRSTVYFQLVQKKKNYMYIYLSIIERMIKQM